MKRENVKPSLLTYYVTRSSLVHPFLAVTQINIAIFLITASPFINQNMLTSTAVVFRQICCLGLSFLLALCAQKCKVTLTLRDLKYLVAIGKCL